MPKENRKAAKRRARGLHEPLADEIESDKMIGIKRKFKKEETSDNEEIEDVFSIFLNSRELIWLL